MFDLTKSFSSFAVNDLQAAKEFYGQTLGLGVTVDTMGMTVALTEDKHLFVYEKADHQPAGFTILNLAVNDIDQAADQLIAAGVTFEHYDMGPMELDDRGVFHSDDPTLGPSIGWFKDPAGNVLALIEV